MSRHIKQIDDHISIAYGYDRPLQGYFIQVYDNRLEWEENKTDEENAKAEEVDPSGDGEINSFATNDKLISRHVVGKNKIHKVLSDYGVNEEHCNCVVLDQPIPD